MSVIHNMETDSIQLQQLEHDIMERIRMYKYKISTIESSHWIPEDLSQLAQSTSQDDTRKQELANAATQAWRNQVAPLLAVQRKAHDKLQASIFRSFHQDLLLHNVRSVEKRALDPQTPPLEHWYLLLSNSTHTPVVSSSITREDQRVALREANKVIDLLIDKVLVFVFAERTSTVPIIIPGDRYCYNVEYEHNLLRFCTRHRGFCLRIEIYKNETECKFMLKSDLYLKCLEKFAVSDSFLLQTNPLDFIKDVLWKEMNSWNK